MAAKKIGGISVAIVADTAKFVQGISRAQSMLGGFAKTIKNTLLSVKGLAAGLAAAFVTSKFVGGITDAAHAIDDLAKTADKLGVTTEALAGLQLAAGEAGIENATLSKALQSLVKNTSNAAQGLGTAKNAYKELGVNVQDLNRLSPDKQFLVIADAMSNVTNQQDQLRIATQLFGSRAASMINVLRAGRGPLEEAAQAAKDLGLAVDRESAAGVERAIDAWERFKMAIQGIFRQIAITVAPVIEVLSKKLVGFMSEGGRAASFGQGIGKFMVDVFKKIGDGFQQVIAGFMQLIADFKTGFANFRDSAVGKAAGLGFASEADSVAARVEAGRLGNAAYKFSQGPSFSSLVDGLIAEADKRRASAPATGGVGAFAKSIGDGITKQIGMAGRTAGDLGKSSLGGIGSLLMGGQRAMAQLPFLAGQKAAMDFAGGSSGMSGNSLSLASSNSREGFSQRVAALRQSENIGKKQLKTQEGIKSGIDKIAKAVAGGQMLLATNLGAG